MRIEIESDEIRLIRGAASVKMRSSAKISIENALWWPDMGYEHATKRLVIAVDPGAAEISTNFAREPGSGASSQEAS